MKSEDDMRAAFEAWCKSAFVIVDLTPWRDSYSNTKFAYAWEAWKAAHANLLKSSND